MSKFKEQMVVKGFNGILNYEVGGLLNQLQDYEEYTTADFKKEVNHDSLMLSLEYELKEAYKKGYLEVDSYKGLIIEAKHLKFLGNAKLKELMAEAVFTMLQDSEVKAILKKGVDK